MYRFIRWQQNWKIKSKDPFVVVKFCLLIFYVILEDLVGTFFGVIFLILSLPPRIRIRIRIRIIIDADPQHCVMLDNAPVTGVCQ